MALEFEIALHAVANTPAILLPPTSRDTVKSIAVSKDNLEQRELITNGYLTWEVSGLYVMAAKTQC